jgi:2-polyprenyl-6-hydroxyphenyl methylase/3-demethylubiquinone-9 3-methyltransferase
MNARNQPERLNALPPLSRENARRDRRACKICRGPADLFDVVDFNKICSESDFYAFGLSGIPVYFLRCRDCGFLYTEFCDGWSAEDFSRWIYNADYALADSDYREVRPAQFAKDVSIRLRGLEAAAILDYGSGAGVFSARMRLNGFGGAEEYDPFSSPERPDGEFDLVTCFEVLEHSPDPLETLQDMRRFLKPDGCILFSQTLQPANILELRGNWWYAAPRNGHVSLFTAMALAFLAGRVAMTVSGRNGLFMFRSADASSVTQRLFDEFAPALIPRRLQAPAMEAATAEDPGGRGRQWHGLETDSRGSFRWSALDTITWKLDPAPCYPCELLVSIPFLMLAFPGVLEGATLKAGDHSSPVSVDGSEIRASMRLPDAGVSEITLCTQAPRSPQQMRGEADRRPLGIAVLAAAMPQITATVE